MLWPHLHKDDSHEFKPILNEIEDSPVSPLAHATFWLIIGTIAFFVVWSIVGTMDIVVSAPGKVIPHGHEKVVQTLESGIVSKLNVREGDSVRKGQILVEIDSSVASDELLGLKKKYEHTQLEIERIRSTLSGGAFMPGHLSSSASEQAADSQRQLHDANQQLLATQLLEKEAQMRQLDEEEKQTITDREMYSSLMKLAQEKEKRIKPLIDVAIPRDEWDKVQGELLTDRSKIEQDEHKLLQLAHQKQAILEDISKTKKEFQTTHLNDLSQKEKEVAELHAQVRQMEFRTRKQVIVSPTSGYVDEMFVHTVGGVVSPAEKLLTIIPSDATTAIVTSVSNRDIGFVSVGLPVQIKIDTFDFQKYGMLEGKVSLVAFDSHDNEGKALTASQSEKKLDQVFEVYISPKSTSVKVDGRNEKLKPGMTVLAEFKVGKRRIIEFFLYPLLKNWQEGISVR